MDVIIEELIVEKDRPEHIEKHGVSIKEVLEIIEGDYLVLEGKFDKSLLIGKTKRGRKLTVVVGKRRGKNKYGLVTARHVKKKEEILYQKYSDEGKNESNVC